MAGHAGRHAELDVARAPELFAARLQCLVAVAGGGLLGREMRAEVVHVLLGQAGREAQHDGVVARRGLEQRELDLVIEYLLTLH